MDIISFLSDQLIRGWVAFLTAKYLNLLYQTDKITSSRHFFAAAYLSCTESSILALSRIIITHGDSISVEHLLNCVTQNAARFPHADKQTVLRSVDEHMRELYRIEIFLGTLKTHRDRTLAHLDRKYVNNPTEIFATPDIDMRQVEQTYRLLLNILNTYKGYVESSDLHLSALETDIESDLDYLISLMV